MGYVTKRHIVKIPKGISVYYCDIKHIIVLTSSFGRKTLVLKTKAIVKKEEKVIKITRDPFFNMSNNERKKLKAIQGTQVNLLKQKLSDLSLLFCKKLNLVGVGYRVADLKLSNLNILHFKLGYSHGIYFKIPENLKIFCLKANKLFIIGSSYLFVTQVAAVIRSFKVPEPYKGKGILYTTEKIVIKEGKKI